MSMTIEEALEKVFEINDKVASLNKEAEPYKELIKTEMARTNASKLTLANDPNRICTLTSSVRRTCKDKAGFVSQLASIGARHCIATEIVPDMDVLKCEIDINPNVKALYDNFVKESEVQTFKVK